MYLKYAQSLVKQYDRNGDGVLTAEEWKGMSSKYQSADANHDGKITVDEVLEATKR